MKLPNLTEALQRTRQTSTAATLGTEEMEAELERRRARMPFPLDVFPAAFRPYLTELIEKLQIDRGFAGLSVLQAAASAIGSGLRVESGLFIGPVNLWTCLVGLTSSGKSVAQGELLHPIRVAQARYDAEYLESMEDNDEDSDQLPPVRKTLLVQDITFESLIRDVLSQNFRGITKVEDELVKFLSDLSRYKSSKSEEPFWLSGWSSGSNFLLQRAGGKVTIVEQRHLVVNLTGTTQRNLLRHFFDGDKLDSGFSSRFLFALAEENRVTDPKLSAVLTEEFKQAYTRVIDRLLRVFNMPYRETEPYCWSITRPGLEEMEKWQTLHSRQINALKYGTEMEVKAGIFGKIKVYVSRFAGLLQAMHYAAEERDLSGVKTIAPEFVTMALRLGDYFMQSNWEAFCVARSVQVAPPDVLEFLGALKACHFNQAELARRLKVTKQAINKRFKEYSRDYPNLFIKP
jgi:hypothetical protein